MVPQFVRATAVRMVTACPSEVPQAEWSALAAVLDASETRHSARFAFDADRRGYVLAHALRRFMLGDALGVAPSSLRFRQDDRGKPQLAWPEATGLHFSHSRSRQGVACVLTRLAPIGVDIEPVDARRADCDLLAPYVVANEIDFFRCWTALEAFWKSAGIGLAHDSPRIRLEQRTNRMDVCFELGECTPCGVVMTPPAVSGCAVAVALRAPLAGEPVMVLTHCQSVLSMKQLGRTQGPLINFARPSIAA